MSKLDLSDIKENDLDKTSSFVDLMSRSERKNRKHEKELETKESDIDDIEEMVEERKKSTKDLTKDLQKANDEANRTDDDDISKTQILDLTRQMKFNFEEQREENVSKKKKGISPLNIIGEINLLCIGYYIYLLLFTDYQDNRNNYLIAGGIIVLLVLLFGMSVVTSKKISNFFKILNVIAIFSFIVFNIYSLCFQ